jgi:hypothetical protein
VNFIANYAINDVMSVSGRIEHFDDNGALYPTSITGSPGFKASSAGGCMNFKLHKWALARFEARQFFSAENVYFDKNLVATGNSTLLIGSLTAWF